MHSFEYCLRTMQDCHQIDHRVMTLHSFSERRLVMDIQFQQSDQRQVLQMARVGSAPGRHGYMPALPYQLLAHMGTDKAGATDKQYILHATNVARCSRPHRHAGSKDLTGTTVHEVYGAKSR
jgi:hypothetical protein